MRRVPDWLRPPDQQEVSRASHVSRMALRGLLRSRLPQMAAALAYRTLFGLLPISIVALVIVRMFVGDDDLKRLIEQAVRYTGIAEVIESEMAEALPEAVDQPAPLAQGFPSTGVIYLPMPFTSSIRVQIEGDGRGATDEPPIDEDTHADPKAPLEATTPDTGLDTGPDTGPDTAPDTTLDTWIEEQVRRFGAVRFDAIGLVGGLVLIYAALAMVVEVERCFNQVCRAQIGRSWTRRITQYWTLMTLGAILIALTFLVSVQFREWVRGMAGEGDAMGRFIVGVAGFLITVVISTGLLTLAYMILPNRRLRLRPVVAGALVAAIGWEAAKWGFTQYLGFATNSTYATLYGSLALIPLFMLWVFLTWLIVLFGLQVAYGVQMLEDGVHQEDATVDGPSLVLAGPGLMIDAAAVVAARFALGKAARSSDIASELALASDQSVRILEALAEAGFVRELDREGGFTLARPADRIRLADLATAGATQSGAREGSATRELSAATVQALGEATLQSRVKVPSDAQSPVPQEAPCLPQAPRAAPPETPPEAPADGPAGAADRS